MNNTDRFFESIDDLSIAHRAEAKLVLITQIREVARQSFPVKLVADQEQEGTIYSEVMRLCQLLEDQIRGHMRQAYIETVKDAEMRVIVLFDNTRKSWWPFWKKPSQKEKKQ